MSWSALKNKIIISLFFGLLVIIGFAFFADLRQLPLVLEKFQWGYLPLVLGLTLLNYVIRFAKWHWYTRLIGAQTTLAHSFSIFVAAMSMVMTPAKAGELLKAYMLRVSADVSFARAAPIIFAERVTDGLAMILLSLVGLTFYQTAWPALLTLLVIMGGAILVVQSRTLSLKLIAWGERLPLLARFIHQLHEMYESSYELLRWRNLIPSLVMGLVSWFAECLAFYLVLVGLGVAPSATLLLQATFIFAFATVVGAVSALPGGLFAAEASIGGLLILLVGLSRELSVAATLIIRLCTLWLGVAIGLVALVVYRKRFFTSESMTSTV